jgi:hypothetical protein
VLPRPIHGYGTVRRQTGRQQTFQDWICTSNNEVLSKQHERYPSLEHGLAPVISNIESSVYSRPTISRAGTTARPGTRDSMDASSLRRAVLEAAEPGNENDLEYERAGRKNVVVKETKTESKRVGENGAMKGYSGAWP